MENSSSASAETAKMEFLLDSRPVLIRILVTAVFVIQGLNMPKFQRGVMKSKVKAHLEGEFVVGLS